MIKEILWKFNGIFNYKGNGRKHGSYDDSDHTPKLLPCSHTLCLQCLTSLSLSTSETNEAEIQCPICRHRVSVPVGGVTNLPPSFVVNQLLEMLRKQKKDVIKRCYNHPSQVRIFQKWYNLHYIIDSLKINRCTHKSCP